MKRFISALIITWVAVFFTPPVWADSTKMYWTDYLLDKIQRANLDGSDIEDLITGLDSPQLIDLDLVAGKMYWTNFYPARILRANLDGSNIEDLLPGLDYPYGIALDIASGKMYWTDPGTDKIQRANLNGTNVEDLITGIDEAYDIALDLHGGKMYWTVEGLNIIQRANLDGSNIENLVAAEMGMITSIDLDTVSGKMYWTCISYFGEGDFIRRANLDGSSIETLVTLGYDSPGGITCYLPDGKIYWTDYYSGKIQRANLNGSNVEDIVTGLYGPVGLAIPTIPCIDNFEIEPATSFNSSGSEGGPFAPASKTYTLQNTGPNSINWTASVTQNWLDVSPSSGTLGPNDVNSVQININSNAAGLNYGSYSDTLTITNLTSGIVRSRPVELRVYGPIIELSQNEFYFDADQDGNNPANQVLGISNIGGGVLNWQVSETCGWLSVDPTCGSSTSEMDDVNIIVDISGLAAGIYNCQLTVSSDHAENSPQIVNVQLRVIGPIIELSENAFYFTAMESGDNPANQVLGISNVGSNVLNWQISETCDWLSIDPTCGSSTSEVDEVNIIVNISGLTRGIYTCEFLVSSDDAENSPQIVTVELRITGPVIKLSQNKFYFEAEQGGDNPPRQVLGISNIGAGVLNWQVSSPTGGWLSVDPNCGSSTSEVDEVNIIVDINGLTKGTDSCVLLVSDANAENSPQSFTVELRVAPMPEFKLTASDGAEEDIFGTSVSIDGDRCIVGAPWDNDMGDYSGSAYIFEWDGTSWTEHTKLTASDGKSEEHFGTSVDIDGDRCIVGGCDNGMASYHKGRIYLFEFNDTSWIEQQKLTISEGVETDFFGLSVGISGNRCIVGDFGDDDYGTESGAAYIFEWNGTSWIQQAKLTASDGAAGDRFGSVVDIDGDRCIIGAWYDNVQALYSGSAYVFEWNGSAWIERAKLTDPNGGYCNYFGWSVSISDDRCIVGSVYDDDNGYTSGSAFIFEWDGSDWIQQDKLLASDGAAEDCFGHSVSIDGDQCTVGASGVDPSGSAYVFEWDGMTWVEQKLLASDGAKWDSFGSSVSVCNGRYLVGAPGDDDNGGSSGSAYVFHHYRKADLDKNFVVDFYDFAILASQWWQPPGISSADFAPMGGDGFVDYNDLSVFCLSWLD